MEQLLRSHYLAISKWPWPTSGVPYCAVDASGRVFSREEWDIAKSTYVLRDDYRLCFHGPDARPWSEWAMRVSGPWSDTSSPKPVTLWTFLKIHEDTLLEKIETVGAEPPRPTLDVVDVPKIVELSKRTADHVIAALSTCSPLDRMYTMMARMGKEIAHALQSEKTRIEFKNDEDRMKRRARETMRVLQNNIKSMQLERCATEWIWSWGKYTSDFVPAGATSTQTYVDARRNFQIAMQRWWSLIFLYMRETHLDRGILSEMTRECEIDDPVMDACVRALIFCNIPKLDFVEWTNERRVGQIKEWATRDPAHAWFQIDDDVDLLSTYDFNDFANNVYNAIEERVYVWDDETQKEFALNMHAEHIVKSYPTTSLEISRNTCEDVSDALVDMYQVLNDLYEQSRLSLSVQQSIEHERASREIIKLKDALDETHGALLDGEELGRTIEARWETQIKTYEAEYQQWMYRCNTVNERRDYIHRVQDAIERAIRYRMREMDCSLTLRDVEDRIKKDAEARRAQMVIDAETRRQEGVVTRLLEWDKLKRENKGTLSEIFERSRRENKSVIRVVEEMEKEQHDEIHRIKGDVLNEVMERNTKRARREEEHNWDTSQHA